jgi:hypothetical protein
MKRILSLVVVALVVAAMVLVMAMTALADGKDNNAAQAMCSEATLDGRYLFSFDGYQIKGDEKVPFAQAGYEVYDGNGHVKGVYSGNFGGEIIRNQPISGTYTVKAGCTKLLSHLRDPSGVTDRTQLRQGGPVSPPILQIADVPVQAETILEVPEEVHPLHVSRYVLAGQHDRNRAVLRGPSLEDAGQRDDAARRDEVNIRKVDAERRQYISLDRRAEAAGGQPPRVRA